MTLQNSKSKILFLFNSFILKVYAMRMSLNARVLSVEILMVYLEYMLG